MLNLFCWIRPITISLENANQKSLTNAYGIEFAHDGIQSLNFFLFVATWHIHRWRWLWWMSCRLQRKLTFRYFAHFAIQRPVQHVIYGVLYYMEKLCACCSKHPRVFALDTVVGVMCGAGDFRIARHCTSSMICKSFIMRNIVVYLDQKIHIANSDVTFSKL